MSLPANAFKQFCTAQFSFAANFNSQINCISGVIVNTDLVWGYESNQRLIKLEFIGSLLSMQH